MQVLFDLNSTKQTQFTVAVAFGLYDQTTCSVKYSINNTKLGIIISTSLPLKCGVEKQKDHFSKRRKRMGTS